MDTLSLNRITSLPRALRLLTSRLLGLVIAAFGLAFMLAVLLLGLIAGSVLVAWALLRGRRPTLRFGRSLDGWHRSVRMGPRAGRRAPVGDVVDIEAREVTPPGSGPR